LPCEMMAMSMQSRSTISSTCEVKKTVRPRAVRRESRSLSVREDLLSRLTARGLTVFLTSHVLEIVERLCTDIAIISQGRLVAAGPLSELRRGIEVEGDEREARGPLSLEDYFIHVVGGVRRTSDDVLLWMT